MTVLNCCIETPGFLSVIVLVVECFGFGILLSISWIPFPPVDSNNDDIRITWK